MEFDLRIIRALLDLTTEELANDLGVTRQTISNLEKGRSKATKIFTRSFPFRYIFRSSYEVKTLRERIQNGVDAA